MSIKNMLMPVLAQRLLSRQRLLKQRTRAERARVARGERHQLHYFHQVDDPYSALAAASLPMLAARYDIDILPHVLGPPRDDVAPERDKLIAYSRKDAQLLARHWGLDFRDTGAQPSQPAVERATCLLVAAIETGRFVEVAGTISACLWQDTSRLADITLTGGAIKPVASDVAASHLAAADALRHRLGHYLGATFFYGGEWYWGIDRLHHLESRLQDLGAQRPGVHGLMFPPDADMREPLHIADPAPIDLFFSLRSPYSAIVAPRISDWGV